MATGIDRKSNPVLVELIGSLKAAGRENQAPLWRDIASRLEKPSRNWAQVNLSKIDAHLGDGETAVVVSHGAALRVAVPAFLGWGDGPAHALGVLANCGWVELEHSASTWTGGVARWRLMAWNRVAT